MNAPNVVSLAPWNTAHGGRRRSLAPSIHFIPFGVNPSVRAVPIPPAADGMAFGEQVESDAQGAKWPLGEWVGSRRRDPIQLEVCRYIGMYIAL